jgi:hypothetical protein
MQSSFTRKEEMYPESDLKENAGFVFQRSRHRQIQMEWEDYKQTIP